MIFEIYTPPIILPQNKYADTAGYYLTTGISANLPDATRQAIREMLTWLARNISSDESYVIACVADTRPNFVALI